MHSQQCSGARHKHGISQPWLLAQSASRQKFLARSSVSDSAGTGCLAHCSRSLQLSHGGVRFEAILTNGGATQSVPKNAVVRTTGTANHINCCWRGFCSCRKLLVPLHIHVSVAELGQGGSWIDQDHFHLSQQQSNNNIHCVDS